ncbi:MAG: hypothetical protein HYV09_21465 [Deltaproteobacteria bacterium]|nr:hypothetical protein [Deltaproteobacteria bacterium]
MSDDGLDRATAALREETADADREALQATRTRMLAAHRESKRRRTRLLTWTLPLAAAFVIGTAWAATTGRLVAIFPTSKTAPPPPTAPSAAPRNPVGGPAAPLPSVAPTVVVTAPSASAPVVESAPPPVAATSTVASPPVAAAPSVVASAPPSASIDRVALDLARYQKAHTLHFVDKKYGAALAAWDAYLAASSGGGFVAEARYNRAICLLKLGRRDEGMAALQPFADGAVEGGYRKAEARKLLDALEADASSW